MVPQKRVLDGKIKKGGALLRHFKGDPTSVYCPIFNQHMEYILIYYCAKDSIIFFYILISNMKGPSTVNLEFKWHSYFTFSQVIKYL